MTALLSSLPSMATIKSDIKTRPARWAVVLVVLFLMVDILSVAMWMTFPSFKIGGASSTPAALGDASATTHAASPAMLLFMEKLRDAGANPGIVRESNIRRPPLSVPGTLITLEGDNIQIFEYADRTTVLREAEELLKSGANEKARLYADGQLLILYTGNRDKVVNILAQAIEGPDDAERLLGGYFP